MAMRALAASALTMVTWLEHPHLTFLLLTPLLQQIHNMLKKVKTKTTTMSKASRRPPQHFLVLNDNGGEISIKARPSSFVFSSVLSRKIGLSGFAQQNFSSIFSPLALVDLKNICYVVCNALNLFYEP
jgi:hypothetical protein